MYVIALLLNSQKGAEAASVGRYSDYGPENDAKDPWGWNRNKFYDEVDSVIDQHAGYYSDAHRGRWKSLKERDEINKEKEAAWQEAVNRPRF